MIEATLLIPAMASSVDRPTTGVVGVFQQSLSVDGDNHKVALNRHHKLRRTQRRMADLVAYQEFAIDPTFLEMGVRNFLPLKVLCSHVSYA